MPIRANKLLIVAVGAELSFLLVLLYVPPVAHLLGQAGPIPAGCAAAAAAVPALLLADAAHKRLRRGNPAIGPIGRDAGDHRP